MVATEENIYIFEPVVMTSEYGFDIVSVLVAEYLFLLATVNLTKYVLPIFIILRQR